MKRVLLVGPSNVGKSSIFKTPNVAPFKKSIISLKLLTPLELFPKSLWFILDEKSTNRFLNINLLLERTIKKNKKNVVIYEKYLNAFIIFIRNLSFFFLRYIKYYAGTVTSVTIDNFKLFSKAIFSISL